MFIVQASEKNRLKPHRGGMKLPGAAHAAPTGLKRIAGRGVAINMSPRWGLVQAGQCTSIQAVELRESQGLKVRELAKAQALATEHQGLISDKWHERFNR
jgi:hypothetical protein